MKKSNEHTLKQVIDELIKSYNLDDKLKETNLTDCWGKIVGKMIAKHTNNLFLHKKILYVKLDSAALRNELSFSKQKIIKLINKEVKEDIIEQIVFE
jgi:predicted nucleic acid-binding Zn ribbon protein